MYWSQYVYQLSGKEKQTGARKVKHYSKPVAEEDLDGKVYGKDWKRVPDYVDQHLSNKFHTLGKEKITQDDFCNELRRDKAKAHLWISGIGGCKKAPLLCAAALEGYVEIIKVLLECGVDQQLLSKERDSALHYAGWCTNHDAAVEVATHLLRAPHVEDVINLCGNGGKTPLHRAVVGPNVKLAELLLQHGADVNKGDRDGYSPLIMVTEGGDNETLATAVTLLNNRANINDVYCNKCGNGNSGRNALHWAVQEHRPEKQVSNLNLLHALLWFKADLNKVAASELDIAS